MFGTSFTTVSPGPPTRVRSLCLSRRPAQGSITVTCALAESVGQPGCLRVAVIVDEQDVRPKIPASRPCRSTRTQTLSLLVQVNPIQAADLDP